jgi:NADH-quinone oxidoreductase subunit H
MTFSVFFLAEYANMILIALLTSIMFLGGWLSPLNGILPASLLEGEGVSSMVLGDGIHWLLAKTSFFLFLFLWFRATFPRYRYDQIMRLGWKIFIPITIVWLLVAAGLVVGKVGPWFS